EDYKWLVQGGGYQVLSPEPLAPIRPRVNLSQPEQSLLVAKPAMTVPHGGGRLFPAGSRDYQTLLDWIRKGAPFGEDSLAGARIEAAPREAVLDPGQSRQLRVEALDSRGRRENITAEVRYESLNPEVARVRPGGLIEAASAGETTVIVRWVGRVASVRVGVNRHRIEEDPRPPIHNYIDEHIFAKLRRFHILPSGLASDPEFLRRICLDLTGRLPPPARAREFLSNQDPQKRRKLVDTLLASPEYTEFWTFRFSDLFRVRGEYNWILPFWEWVRHNVATNKPYDQVAREAIGVQGYGGSAHLYMFGTNKPFAPEQILNETVRVFMGRRLDCAQCHNHPFDRWTQNQYWGLAAFFGRMTNTGWGHDNALFDDPNGHEEDYVENQPELRFRRVLHPRTKQLVAPAFLEGPVLAEEKRADLRAELARWITRHPYFAEAAANRLWGYFFGRGIVDPVDDFRLANPPSHPELLEALARDFRDHGFDLKHLIRRIVTSRAYQLSSAANESNRADSINYSHSLPRPLEAEVLLDAISQVTGVPEAYGDMPPGTRAVQLRFPGSVRSSFLEIYESPRRDVVPERSGKAKLAQALHRLAGATYNEKISKKGGRLDRLLEAGIADRDLIEEFYLAALSRFPTERELAGHMKLLRERPRREVAEDLVWALLSSREFSENH
ncbi:MAG: DUF1553 domain-containing protein, partial [Acidobacteria bacterium]|nr:DUF1553 domain-containing protein [Acidobacteriota bacterium]